jgi:hypothetical protein
MFLTKKIPTILTSLGLAALLLVALTAVPAYALMAQTSELTVTSRSMTATAAFTLGTPCSPYTLDWGDGKLVKQIAEKDMMCIQILDDVTLTHTYEEPGDYVVSLTANGRTSTQTAVVPTEVREFALSEVVSVTSLWVDPSELMADEEYILYTITLNDGAVIVVKAGGFTTKEWIKEQFVEAGYTGDVETLTALAEPEVAEDSKPAPEEAETAKKIELQKRIIELLKQIISLLGLR